MSQAAIRGRSVGGHGELLARLAAVLLVVLTIGCAGNQPRLDAAPANVYATPVGFRGIRYWGDSELKKLDQAIAERREQLAVAAKSDKTINLKRHQGCADQERTRPGSFRGIDGRQRAIEEARRALRDLATA
jgi:hypothetical protein